MGEGRRRGQVRSSKVKQGSSEDSKSSIRIKSRVKVNYQGCVDATVPADSNGGAALPEPEGRAVPAGLEEEGAVQQGRRKELLLQGLRKELFQQSWRERMLQQGQREEMLQQGHREELLQQGWTKEGLQQGWRKKMLRYVRRKNCSSRMKGQVCSSKA